ncbi:MAG: hypothetical protein PHP01_01315 [Phycisphaerae bacterium]|nr:hypothetical protein [Phycisphaerae bacterium]
MRKFIKITAFILLGGSLLFSGLSTASADSGGATPSYVYGRQSDATLSAVPTLHTKHSEKCVGYCISNISNIDLFGKALRFSIYSANDISSNCRQHESLFCQNCLLQI